MPELPEVETIRRGLARAMEGGRITEVCVLRRDLRQPIPAGLEEAVRGRRILEVARRAKYLLLHLQGGSTLLLHLGMSGRVLVRPHGAEPLRKHDHFLIKMDHGMELVFHDPRRFGLMLLIPTAQLSHHPLLRHLAPEPFSEECTEEYLAAALRRRKGAIKPALMDAKLLVGVGNIYASEALFRARIHPETPASSCTARAAALLAAVQSVLKEAIAAGGSTLRDYTAASGEMGYFQHRFAVYGRAGMPCPSCGTAIIRRVQSGRSGFFCPRCQKERETPARNM
jgi:formamidopyrimidine-DNA glycosylase